MKHYALYIRARIYIVLQKDGLAYGYLHGRDREKRQSSVVLDLRGCYASSDLRGTGLNDGTSYFGGVIFCRSPTFRELRIY